MLLGRSDFMEVVGSSSLNFLPLLSTNDEPEADADDDSRGLLSSKGGLGSGSFRLRLNSSGSVSKNSRCKIDKKSLNFSKI